MFWGGISIRSGLLNDSDQVKIRWNFTEIPGVGDLKNAGNKKNEEKMTVCSMPERLRQMKKTHSGITIRNDSAWVFLKNYKNEAAST